MSVYLGSKVADREAGWIPRVVRDADAPFRARISRRRGGRWHRRALAAVRPPVETEGAMVARGCTIGIFLARDTGAE
jgi:hypothetical protein